VSQHLTTRNLQKDQLSAAALIWLDGNEPVRRFAAAAVVVVVVVIIVILEPNDPSFVGSVVQSSTIFHRCLQ
jgi:hypothetical protein